MQTPTGFYEHKNMRKNRKLYTPEAIRLQLMTYSHVLLPL